MKILYTPLMIVPSVDPTQRIAVATKNWMFMVMVRVWIGSAYLI